MKSCTKLSTKYQFRETEVLSKAEQKEVTPKEAPVEHQGLIYIKADPTIDTIRTSQCSELFFHGNYTEEHTVLASRTELQEGSNPYSHGRSCQKPEYPKFYERIKHYGILY